MESLKCFLSILVPKAHKRPHFYEHPVFTPIEQGTGSFGHTHQTSFQTFVKIGSDTG